VSFKCSLRNYLTNANFPGDELRIGDYVSVECEKGYDIGILSRELFPETDHLDEQIISTLYPILGKVEDEKNNMEELLRSKIIAENESLGLCRNYCHGRKVGSFLEVIATEFQYDHKKLTLYVTKSGEVSVCKLVRKLFDSFHTRICVEEINSVDLVITAAQRYLELTQINLNLSEVYFEPSRMPPQSEASRNQKGNKKNQRSQNGYTQSGANSTLLSALHQYRPTYSSGMNNAPPYTMGYAAPLPAHTNAPPAPASIMYPPQPPSIPTQHTRFEQRFNERVYNPQSLMRDMNSQYRMYDSSTSYTPTTITTSLVPESDLNQYPVGIEYHQQPSPYYSSAMEETMMYPQNVATAPPYQSPYNDPNLYPYGGDPSAYSQNILTGPYHSYSENINPPIALPLPDQPVIPINLSLESSAVTAIAPSISSLEESEYPHYVVRY
jgi:hypothetical protein